MADVKNWMFSLPDSVNLAQLSIPGTHNSATRFVSASWITKCQHTAIPRQLAMGVRLLDIRMELKGDTFVLVHSVIDCRKGRIPGSAKITFRDVLADCLHYLNMHKGETILLSIKEDDGHNGDVFFSRFYQQFIAPYMDRWFLENRFPSLGECRGKLVLLRRCGTGEFGKQEGTGIDLSRWPDQGNRKSHKTECCDLQNGGASMIIQDRYTHLPISKWSKVIVPALQTAQPDERTAFLHMTSTAGGLVPYLSAKYINRRLSAYLDKNKKLYGWFMADFITPALCEKIIGSGAKK